MKKRSASASPAGSWDSTCTDGARTSRLWGSSTADPSTRRTTGDPNPSRASSNSMIIDCHGHYTTAPSELQLFRDTQIAQLKAPRLVVPAVQVAISDDLI